MNKISAVIITHNEERNIARCIESLRGIADEVIVVDSFSTDRTIAIAQEMGTKTYIRSFDTYGLQKNYANSFVSGDYILSLDADEALSDELKDSIRQAKNNFTADVYSMNRLNYYCGKPVRTCGWYPDEKLRLFRKDKAKWNDALVHEVLQPESKTTVSHLQGDILHYTYATPQDLANQSEKFASISARQLKSKPLPYLFVKMIFSPLVKFLQNYFLNLGFTEGYTGWVICYNQAREAFLKYFRAIKLKLF